VPRSQPLAAKAMPQPHSEREEPTAYGSARRNLAEWAQRTN